MVLGAILVPVVLVAACRGGSATSTRTPSAYASTVPSPTFVASELMLKYAAASAPFAQAELQYNAALNALSTDPAVGAPSFVAANGPYAAALKQFDAALPTLPWPSSMSSYVQALLTAHALLLSDLAVAVTPSNYVAVVEKTLADRTSAARALQALQQQPGVLAI